MAKKAPVTFKKKNLGGQCRARRCMVKATDDVELYEHETTDPTLGTVLLCTDHWRRAEADSEAAPATDGVTPAVDDWSWSYATSADGVTPMRSPDGGVTWENVPPEVLPEIVANSEDPTTYDVVPAPAVVVETTQIPPAAVAVTAQTAVVVEHSEALALVEPMAAEYTGMAGQLVGFIVNDQATVDTVGKLLLEVKGRLSALEKARKRITKPLLDAKRAVDALFRPGTSAAETVETLLKNALSAHVVRQQQAQVALLSAGQHETALAVVQPEMPAGVSTRTVWKWRVTDPNLIPAEYMVVDAGKVQAHVNQMKGQSTIPGIEAFPSVGVSASTKGAA